MDILPSVRGLNKVRGCAAVSIGEKYQQSNRGSWPNRSPSESGLCVKPCCATGALGISIPVPVGAASQTLLGMLGRQRFGTCWAWRMAHVVPAKSSDHRQHRTNAEAPYEESEHPKWDEHQQRESECPIEPIGQVEQRRTTNQCWHHRYVEHAKPEGVVPYIPGRSHNGRFLRRRFSPKPKVIATQNSLPKRNHVAKEAVSAAWQAKTRQRSE